MAVYSATLLEDITNSAWPPLPLHGASYGSSGARITDYDAANDRVQIAGHTGESLNNKIYSVAGMWQMDAYGLPVINGIDLPVHSRVTASGANGINNTNAPVIVGWIEENNNGLRIPARWDQSGMKKLVSLGGNDGVANDINDAGQIVGYSRDSKGNQRAFFWTEGDGTIHKGGQPQMIDLGTLGGLNSEALAINNSGQVVGWAEDENKIRHPFIWSFDQSGELSSNKWMRELMVNHIAPGVAYDINDSGHVVGGIGDFPNTHAFFWSAANGGLLLEDLDGGGAVTVAKAINSKDEIVGFSTTDYINNMHAVKWTNFTISNLNVLLAPSGNPVHLDIAYDINSDGQIICSTVVGNFTVPVYLSESLYRGPQRLPEFYRRNFFKMGNSGTGNGNAIVFPKDKEVKSARKMERRKNDLGQLSKMVRYTAAFENKDLKNRVKKFLSKVSGKEIKKARKLRKKL
jgi:probable HAF family extracellular repeat protein